MSAEEGYRATLIADAGDCPADCGVVPTSGVPAFQYGLLAGRPYELTQADVLFRSAHRDAPPDDVTRADWDAFFAWPRACLRASPLPKRWGWGLYFDDQGRVALVDMASAEYRRLMTDPHTKALPALRSARPRSTP